MATNGDYYANVLTGTIQQITNPILAIPYKTWPWVGPYPTLAAAHAAIDSQPAQKVKSSAGNAAVSAGKAAGSAVVNAIGIQGFFNANIWVRVVEVGLGLLLIVVGVAEITKAVPLATKIAKVVK